MNRSGKKMISCLLVTFMTSIMLGACSLIPVEPDKEPDDGISSSGPVESVETTIDDILDKENPRPDFDAKFDYESGYVPMDPVTPEPEPELPKDEGPFTAYRMEAENAEFTIAGSQTAENQLWKDTFTDYHKLGFDLRFSGNLATRNLNTSGTTAHFRFTSDKTYGGVELKVLIGGYPNSNMGLSEMADIRVNKKAVDTQDITVNSSDCVLLGHNEYMIFKLVTLSVSIQEGENEITFKSLQARGNNLDYIELHTSANITGWDSEHWSDETSVWTVTQAPTVAEAGKLTVTSTVEIDSNGTTADQVQAYTLPALSAENGYTVEKTSETNTRYSFLLKGEKIYFDYDPTLNFSLKLMSDCGVTFADGKTEATLFEGDAMPEILNATGREIAGWYSVNDRTRTWAVGEFAMPKEGLTIAPYFKAEGQALSIGSGKTDQLPDYFDRFGATEEEKATDDYKVQYDGTKFASATDIVAGEKGVALTHSGTLYANDYFRLLTACGTKNTDAGITANVAYRFWFTLENRGETVVSFDLIQVQGGVRMSDEEGAIRTETITLRPGDSKRVSIEIKLTNANANAMTIVYMQSEVTGLNLGIAMSKVNNIILNPDQKYTLSLRAPAGISFDGGETQVCLAEGAAMPTVTNTTGRTIAGWYDVSDGTAFETFVMKGNDMTIAPYFAAKEGYQALTPGNEQASNLPNPVGGLTKANFSFDSAIVAGGTDGFAALGRTYSYQGEMATGGYFRLASVVSTSNAVVAKGVNHTFAYNFENKGKTAIDLTMYCVNSGTTKEKQNGDVNKPTVISLQPGESMSVEVIANYANGSNNKNVMALFEVNSAMNDMVLGLSISLKLGS